MRWRDHSLGFVLKLYRIVRVYSSLKTLRTRVYTAKQISKMLVVILLLNIGGLLLWVLISPLKVSFSILQGESDTEMMPCSTLSRMCQRIAMAKVSNECNTH